MLSISVTGDREVIRNLKKYPEKVNDALYRKIYALTLELERKVKSEKLSGQVLNVKTGSLRSSVYSRVTRDRDGAEGKVAVPPDVPYGAIHEFGGVIEIPEITPVKAKALHWIGKDGEMFAKRVRAHTITMPERSYLRSSLSEMKDDIINGVKEAVLAAVKE